MQNVRSDFIIFFRFFQGTSSSMSGWDGLGSLVGAEAGGGAMVPSAWRQMGCGLGPVSLRDGRSAERLVMIRA